MYSPKLIKPINNTKPPIQNPKKQNATVNISMKNIWAPQLSQGLTKANIKSAANSIIKSNTQSDPSDPLFLQIDSVLMASATNDKKAQQLIEINAASVIKKFSLVKIESPTFNLSSIG